MTSDQYGLVFFSTDESIAEDLGAVKNVDTLLCVRVRVQDLHLSRFFADHPRDDLIVHVAAGRRYDPVLCRGL
jgi:hypothetical protein